MKYFVLICIFCIAAIGFVEPVAAQNLAGQAQCTGVDCSACNLVSLANAIIKWLIGFLFVLFGVLMAIAGWGLVISGGNMAARDAAKEKFTNAIIGFIIILASWLVVDTIMRGLVGTDGIIDGGASGSFFWSEISCQSQFTAEKADQESVYLDDIDYASLPTWYGDPTVDSGVMGPSGPMPQGCSGGTCASLDIPCKNQNSCSVAPSVKNKIEAMHAAAGVKGARVTEGMPPTRTHKSPCHSNGTCVDYSKAGGMTAAEVRRVVEAARSQGLRPVYEVSTQGEKNNLVTQGVPAVNIQVLGGWISAPHFSIYGY